MRFGITTALLVPLSLPAVLATGQNALPTSQEIYARVSPAVVRVSGESGTGTGFIVDGRGWIATADDLVGNAGSITVVTSAGDVYDDARLRVRDARRNLAVLEIPGFDLPEIPLGRADSVRNRDTVVVLGMSADREAPPRPSISEGIVSLFEPDRDGFRAFGIEAAMSAGFRGAPVLSARGEAVGMIVSVPSGRGYIVMPIDYVRGLIQR